MIPISTTDPVVTPYVHPAISKIRMFYDQRDTIAGLMSSLGELRHETAEALNTRYSGGDGQHHAYSLLLQSMTEIHFLVNRFMLLPTFHTHLNVEIWFGPDDTYSFHKGVWHDEERWGEVIPQSMKNGSQISMEEAMKLVEGIIAHFAKLEANGWRPVSATKVHAP